MRDGPRGEESGIESEPFAGEGDDDLGFGEGCGERLGHPLEGRGVAVDEEELAWSDAGGVGDEFVAGGVAAEVEGFDVGAERDGRVGVVEPDFVAEGGAAEVAAGAVRVSVADEEDGVFGIVDEVVGEVVGDGVFAHHAAAEGVDAAWGGGGEAFAFLGFDEAGHVVEDAEAGVGARDVVRMAVDDLSHAGAEPADVDGDACGEVTCAFQVVDHDEDFLGLAEGEDWDEDAAAAADGAHDGFGEAP